MMTNKVTSFNDDTIRTLPMMRNSTFINGSVKPKHTVVPHLCDVKIWDCESCTYIDLAKHLNSGTKIFVSANIRVTYSVKDLKEVI